MMAREKFSSSQWKRAFAKYSKLGYPSDDDSDENEEVLGSQLELPSRNYASDEKRLTNDNKNQHQSNYSDMRLIKEQGSPLD